MNKDSYQHYSVDELAADPDFQRWATAPSAVDTQFWREVLYTHPHLQPAVVTARQLVLLARANEQTASWPEERKQVTYNRIMQSVQREGLQRSYRRLWISAGAASLLLAMIGTWWFWPGSTTKDIATIYRTGFGETLSVQLPDSSRVTLNANSTLTLSTAWKAGIDRKVILSGEAYFEVAPKPTTGARFTVVTKDLEVNVLGTAFNVFSRERETSVTLDEGTVELHLNGQLERLLTQPGEQVVYSARDKRLLEEAVVPGTQSSWKDGVLVLDDIPLEALGAIIEETFGKRIDYQYEAIREKRITGTIPGAHDLDLLLETVAAALDIKITQTDDRVRFADP